MRWKNRQQDQPPDPNGSQKKGRQENRIRRPEDRNGMRLKRQGEPNFRTDVVRESDRQREGGVAPVEKMNTASLRLWMEADLCQPNRRSRGFHPPVSPLLSGGEAGSVICAKVAKLI